MHLTWKDREKRREQIRAWAAAGCSTAQISYWSGLSVTAINNAIRYVMKPPKPKKPKTKPLTRREQKNNDREFEQRHAAWRKTHVTRCADYPGACYGDHGIANLELLHLPNDHWAMLCCAKIGANLETLGISSQSLDRKILKT